MTRRRGRAAVVAAIFGLATAPGAAHAATVLHASGATQIEVGGAPGEANRVTITSTGGELLVADRGVSSLQSQGDCTPSFGGDPQVVACRTAGVSALTLTGGDGDDELSNETALPAQASGGDGSDLLRGGSAADGLDGGSGDDILAGGAGDDTFAPGLGPPLADADTLSGGDGFDAVDYRTRMLPVSVAKDGVANDGGMGEGDNVGLDVERIGGSLASDTLRGGPGLDALEGGAGEDDLSGGAGDDALDGGDGADKLRGGPGADRLVGGPGPDVIAYTTETGVVVRLDAGTASTGLAGDRDRVDGVERVQGGERGDALTGSAEANGLAGGAGEDYVDGLRGIDALDGGAGADVVVARDDVADGLVSCGPGQDLAIVDRRDRAVRSGVNRCEQVDDGSRRTPTPGRVVVAPRRCAASAGDAALALPAMHRMVPLHYSILLASGFRRRHSPILDAGGCAVRITATVGAGRSAGADVSGDAVSVRQTPGRSVTTELAVKPRGCAGRGRAVARDPVVRVNANRRRGRWRVRGKFSIAASVGTDWTTIDGCSRTTTIVRRGRVAVFDRARNRTVVVRAGHRYVARRAT